MRGFPILGVGFSSFPTSKGLHTEAKLLPHLTGNVAKPLNPDASNFDPVGCGVGKDFEPKGQIIQIEYIRKVLRHC